MRLNKTMIGKTITIHNHLPGHACREFHRHTGRLISYGRGHALLETGPFGHRDNFETREWKLESVSE